MTDDDNLPQIRDDVIENKSEDIMAIVQTVIGPVPSSQLGFTSMHEHVLTETSGLGDGLRQCGGCIPASFFPSDVDKPIAMEDLHYLRHGYNTYVTPNALDDEDLALGELLDFRNAGGGAVLECSAPGIRGDIRTMRKLSEKSGVHIVASTGLYIERTWPTVFRSMDVNDFRSFLLSEIDRGIDGTGVPPGQIKTALDGSVSDPFSKFFRAACEISSETGLMVTAHVYQSEGEHNRDNVVDLAVKSGLSLEKLLMCHAQIHFQELDLARLMEEPDRFNLNLDYVRRLLDSGVNMSIDCFGMVADNEANGQIAESDAYKVVALYHLLKEGYREQLVIGCDVFAKIQTRRYGGHGYLRLHNYVVPTLRRFGVTESDIKNVTVDNPARLLEIK